MQTGGSCSHIVCWTFRFAHTYTHTHTIQVSDNSEGNLVQSDRRHCKCKCKWQGPFELPDPEPDYCTKPDLMLTMDCTARARTYTPFCIVAPFHSLLWLCASERLQSSSSWEEAVFNRVSVPKVFDYLDYLGRFYPPS